MDTINDRLSFLISELAMSRTKFAERLHVTPQFVSALCLGTKSPSDRTISDICREFNVDEIWLRTGEGEMFVKLSRDDEIAAYIAKVLSDKDAVFQRKLLLILSRLSPDCLAELEKVADDILSGAYGEDCEQ